MEMLGSLLLLVLVIGVYLSPAIVAMIRGHHQATAIFVLNLLLGWTLLGWVAALVWAATAIQPKTRNT